MTRNPRLIPVVRGCHSIFLLATSIVAVAYAVHIPTNWKDYIDPAILERDLGSSHETMYGTSRFEGDISGLPVDSTEEQVLAQNVISGKNFRWTGGLVPYQFKSGSFLTSREKSFIQKAMDLITTLTYNCIRFVPRTAERDFITFTRGIVCASDVGRQDEGQTIHLSPACMKDSNYGDVQHELLHALGFFHEVSRKDRDDHVIINFPNIAKDSVSQFLKHVEADEQSLPYDYDSVMHYPFNAFAVDNSVPVILPRKPRARIGQKKNLSPMDVLRIQRAYGCETISDPDGFKPTATEKTDGMELADEAAACSQSLQSPLPDFANRNYTQAECSSVKLPGCHDICTESHCDGSCMVLFCGEEPANLEQLAIQASILGLRYPIRVIAGDREISKEVLAPVSEQVIFLQISDCLTPLTTSKLPQLDLPNLHDFRLHWCKMVVFRRSDFARNCKLRVVLFYRVTFQSIEVGTFLNLPNLRVLSFHNSAILKNAEPERAASARRIHCDCQYTWLRSWWRKMPQFAQHTYRQVYKVGLYAYVSDICSDPSNNNFPVDCAKSDLLSKDVDSFPWGQFSLNDPCLEE